MLKDYASLSGGLLFQTKRADDFKVFTEHIATELHNQYIIEVRPTKAIAKDKCSSFKVKLIPIDNSDKFKSLSLRSRENYCP